MIGIESRDTGIYNFDYFSIDLCEGTYHIGEKEYTLGDAGCAIANLSKETVTQLLILGGRLNQTRIKIALTPPYDRALFQQAGDEIRAILDYIKDIEPFSWFNIPSSRKIVDDVFCDAVFDDLDAISNFGLPEEDSPELTARVTNASQKYKLANALIAVYCYLPNDTANFGMLIQNFTTFLMNSQSRRKEVLALYAHDFCTYPDIIELLDQANLNKDMDGVNLRPRVVQVPVTLWDAEKEEFHFARRLYFGRLMDFLVTEWFEGMMWGHYLWKCGVCEKYFLMTTAHQQLYCGKFNPVYGTTCDHVANNRRLAKKLELPPQQPENEPLRRLRKKRYDSIRKNKSLGKYSEAVSDEAKRLLDIYFERAQIDANYAQTRFEQDITLENLYEKAKRTAT